MHPDSPVYLLGHGAGALIAIVMMKELKFNFSGMILISVALKKPASSKALSAISDVALKMMPNKTGLFQPNYTMNVKNPNATQFLVKDKLIHHDKVMVGSLMQMQNFMKKNEESSWKKLETPPILIVQGQYDKGADPINSIRFYESIKTKDKEYFWVPTMWNFFLLEEEYPQVESRIIQWLEVRS